MGNKKIVIVMLRGWIIPSAHNLLQPLSAHRNNVRFPRGRESKHLRKALSGLATNNFSNKASCFWLDGNHMNYPSSFWLDGNHMNYPSSFWLDGNHMNYPSSFWLNGNHINYPSSFLLDGNHMNYPSSIYDNTIIFPTHTHTQKNFFT
jgi:hypothetical protein